MVSAKVVVMPDDSGGRKVLVNGVEIPCVSDLTLFIQAGSADSVTLTIPVHTFESRMRNE